MKTLLTFALVWCGVAAAQNVTVTGTVSIVRKEGVKGGKVDQANVVVWLKPLGGAGSSAAKTDAPRREIKQTHKRFEPHLLAVPAGSMVWFPNLDPFFHNVFSLYDGNRFDLGLYEAGATHSVKFDRPGICYIFCNIHPEMSAIVVVVEGPYGVSNAAGQVTIPNVAPGQYQVKAWHERAASSTPETPQAQVNVSPENRTLAPISLVDSGELIAPHKDKYGKDYVPLPQVIYKK